MKLNYEVEWELDEEVIDNIVNEIEETIKQYPDCDVDDCILEITANNLSEMDYDECDHFNMEVYFDTVTKEVKKRYLNHKQKITALPATPVKELHSGCVRRIDDLGRICIPKEFRTYLGVEDGEPFEIFFDTDHNIILKKYHA